MWEIKETWDIADKIIDDVLWYGVVFQVEKADVDKGMSKLVNELGLASRVIGEGKVEDWDAGKVGSHGAINTLSERAAERICSVSAGPYDAMIRRYRVILTKKIPLSQLVPSIMCGGVLNDLGV